MTKELQTNCMTYRTFSTSSQQHPQHHGRRNPLVADRTISLSRRTPDPRPNLLHLLQNQHQHTLAGTNRLLPRRTRPSHLQNRPHGTHRQCRRIHFEFRHETERGQDASRGRRERSAQDDFVHEDFEFGGGGLVGGRVDRQPHRHPPHLRLGHVHLRRLRRHPRLLHGNATQIRPHLHSHEFRIPIPLRLPLRFLLSHGQRQLELQRPAGKNHRHHLGSRGGLQYLRLVQVSHLQKDEGEDRGGGR
ncbi:hypothetical protein ACHAXS_011172 [Conticribra weissflogii]